MFYSNIDVVCSIMYSIVINQGMSFFNDIANYWYSITINIYTLSAIPSVRCGFSAELSVVCALPLLSSFT